MYINIEFIMCAIFMFMLSFHQEGTFSCGIKCYTFLKPNLLTDTTQFVWLLVDILLCVCACVLKSDGIFNNVTSVLCCTY